MWEVFQCEGREMSKEFKVRTLNFLETLGEAQTEEEVLKHSDLIKEFGDWCREREIYVEYKQKAEEFKTHLKEVTPKEEWILKTYGYLLNRIVNAPFQIVADGSVIMIMPIMADLVREKEDGM